MTDKEIERGLECCSKDYKDCDNCRYYDNTKHCISNLVKDFLEYVKRLKAEKEQVRKETAKEILLLLDCVPTSDVNELNHLALLKQQIIKKYGGEVDK